MAQWTNKYAIMQDLAVAQGRIVPASLQATFGNNKPPSLNFTEETEEEYFKDCTGDGDFRHGPDIGLIQEMLSMVQQECVSSDDDAEKIPVVSKLNPMCPEFVPTNSSDVQSKETKPDTNKTQTKHRKKRWEKNVALTSLLNALDNASTIQTDQTNEKPTREVETPKLQVTLPAMFKRKQEKTPEKKNVSVESPHKTNGSSYKPSSFAQDYYNELLQRSKMKQNIQEDIWTKAERQMKEIEEKKKLEASKSSSSGSQTSGDGSGLTGLDFVSLSHQRHLLTLQCVVCEVVKKHGYDIQGDL